ncbi:MAG: LytTR family DNA-binding domain-containing protein [Planctomycetia bacterium]
MRTALLVDDEPAASLRLTELLADYPRIKVIGTVESVEEARAFIATSPPDVVFLDVEMPGGSGLELLESLPDSVQVCFVTAYPDYALEAFDHGAVHYLLKPVDPLRLDKAVARLLMAEDAAEPGLVTAAGSEGTEADEGDRVIVLPSGQHAAIRVRDILWIETMGNYTHVCLTGDRQPIVFRRTLASWEAILPAERFKRVGRSQLVHLERITLVRWQSREQTHLFFKERHEPLTIGRYAAARLRELLDS